MKAMILRAPRDLVADAVARPVIDAANDVLVRVTHTGICGTDFKIYSGAIPVNYPRIMGHEISGEVVADGDSAFPARGRVIVDPELYCGACFHCRIGQTHLCPNGWLLGRDANGGFAEYVAAPSSHIYVLPDAIDSRTASLALVEKGLVRLDPLISDVLPLDHLERAIGMLDGDAAYRMKIIMQHQQ